MFSFLLDYDERERKITDEAKAEENIEQVLEIQVIMIVIAKVMTK